MSVLAAWVWAVGMERAAGLRPRGPARGACGEGRAGRWAVAVLRAWRVWHLGGTGGLRSGRMSMMGSEVCRRGSRAGRMGRGACCVGRAVGWRRHTRQAGAGEGAGAGGAGSVRATCVSVRVSVQSSEAQCAAETPCSGTGREGERSFCSVHAQTVDVCAAGSESRIDAAVTCKVSVHRLYAVCMPVLMGHAVGEG